MAFNQTNSFNQSAPQTGEKKKTNFKVGKIYGSDGTMDVSVWNSEKGGCYCIFSIKAAIGKDPSTGANAYEQKMNSELPSIFMNTEIVRALIETIKTQKPDTVNAVIDTGRGAKLTIVGAGNSVKFTIDNQKTGTRNMTLDAVQTGPTNYVHANYLNLIDMIDICLKKAIRNKLNPDEFGMAVATEIEDGDPF